jgi:glc operon protein GlcG
MIEGKSLGLEEAQRIVDAMLEYSSETKPGRPMSHAVVDSAGILIYFARMDGASAITRRMAENKAYTAIMWKRDTREVAELLKDRGRDIVFFGEPDRQAAVPGGVPIKLSDGSIAGAVGSSGRLADEDEEVALVGASTVHI